MQMAVYEGSLAMTMIDGPRPHAAELIEYRALVS